MLDYSNFYARLAQSPASVLLNTVPALIHEWQATQLHGDFSKWLKTLNLLPNLKVNRYNVKNKVAFGSGEDIAPADKAKLEGQLKQFKPWRKGPFELFDLYIDTEWRSDWKWERVLPHLDDLNGRLVLDIGCGSGYHLWRMKGAGADLAVGVDPGQLFVLQFKAIQKYAPPELARDVEILPLGVEHLPESRCFDTVFSMGVLYHRRSPVDFLTQCMAQLRKGGQLVLETLVIEGGEQTVLMPRNRYAQMRNVWFLPSTKALCLWMKRAGYTDIEVVDVNATTVSEQRATDWMDSQSLADFLDKTNNNLTIEGYPAPLRAVITARRP